MYSIRSRRIGVLLALLFGAAACEDEVPPVGGPGTLTFSVVSPNGPEGAMIAQLVGAGIVEVSGLDGRLFEYRDGDTVRVMVVREDAGLLRFTVQLDDTLDLPRVDLVEVADSDNVLRADLASYRVEVVR